MNFIYLFDLANLTIPMIIFLAIASLVFGILIGYLINSKYKNQVEELEREKAKITSQNSSLESELEESRLARSNADGEISLLNNRVRDREARLKETEGKLVITQKRLEEAQAKAVAAVPEVKSSKSLDVETTYIKRETTSQPKKISPLTFTKKDPTPTAKGKVEKKIELGSSASDSGSASGEKGKSKSKKSSTKSSKKSSSSKSKSTKSTATSKTDKKVEEVKGKRGRPKGSKNKTTKTAEATTKVSQGRGRPKGSKNKVKKATSTTTPATPKVAGKRGRPKGSLNKKPATSRTATVKKTTETRGRKRDDLKLIEGIGPKMEEALRNKGIRTFAKISKTSPEKLKAVLVKANPRYAMAPTESWPQQAQLAAAKQFDKLQELKDSLNRGK